MWLMKKSRKVVSVSTSMKDECVSLPKPKSQLTQLHDDDEDVFATSVIDRYAARPLALQNICLATFAVMYDVIQSSTQTGETEDVNTEEDMQNTENAHTLTKMKLQKGLGVIRKRKQQAILYPWNDEDDIISTYQSYHVQAQKFNQEGTKSIQNQKNIIMQSFSSITHGMMKMT